jgi:hypothetical protein
MKTTLTTTIFILITQFCFAQDFWIPLDVPDNFNGRSMDINSLGWLYIGTNDGVYSSTENGFNLRKIGLENVVLGLTVDLQDNVLAGSGPIYLYANNSNQWSEILTPSDVNVIYAKKNEIIYGNWGEIYKSSDFGETWSQVLELSNTQVINAIIENPDGVLFAGITAFFGGGGVYRSLDSGNTWQQIGLNNKFISSLAVSSTGVLYAGSRGEYEYGEVGVFRSEDNGNTWEQIAYNVWVTSMAIDPNDVLYIGCTGEHGGERGVFRSADKGESWEHLITGMANYVPSVEGLSLSPDGHLYAYDYHLYRSARPVFTANAILSLNTHSVKIFPNPFTDTLQIELPDELLWQGPVSVNVSDPTGKLVLSPNITNLQSINLTALPAGLYYISIDVNGQRITRPIVKSS